MGYILVNPSLSSKKIKSNKKNTSEAAEDIWSKLSANIKNYTPKFYFTIQEAGSSKLSHFVIKESVEGQKVKYNLKEFNGKKIDNESLLSELEQKGGKRHRHSRYDDDDSSSSSSSSSEVVFTFPAGKTHKDLLLTYYPTIYGVPNVILPTFASKFAPNVNIGILPNNVIIYNPIKIP
jgi:hypothetical protein